MGFGTGLRSVLDPNAPRKAVPAEAKLLPPLAANTPEQAYPETATRPLFTPTRRPAPEAAAAAQNTFQPGQFVLQGVTIAGDTRIALLREKSTGRTHRIERGHEVNGIKVAEVQPEQVTLAQGGQTETLTLSVQKPAGATSPVQAGPFAPPTPAQAPPPVATGVGPPPTQAATPMAIPGVTPGIPSPSSTGFPPIPGAGANPLQPPAPQAGSTPMSPEELLARRRARRNQQNQ
jgi:hypothetical protein